MTNTPKLNLLMFNMSKYSDWQKGIVNRNFHVLQNLAKNPNVNKIIAVDFLPFNLAKATKTFITDKTNKNKRIFNDLTSSCWQINDKIFVYSTIDSVISPKKVAPKINQLLKKLEAQENLIVWNYNPMNVDYFEKFNQKLNIFDSVDNWLEHSSYKNYQEKLKHNYQLIKEKSDLIFTVSENLKSTLFANQANVSWQPNAVDLGYFQSIKNVSALLNNIPKPIIGFLGILQDRIDTDILTNLAKNNPDKSIVLAGPVWPSFPQEKFSEFKNVYFLGQIKYEEIPELYNGFDVGIIPYKNNEFIKSTDPMKFYEYLAAGLPVVSTPVPGIERFGSLIKVAKTPDEFNQQVNQALTEKMELTPEKLELLRNNTWRGRIEEMLGVIQSELAAPSPLLHNHLNSEETLTP